MTSSTLTRPPSAPSAPSLATPILADDAADRPRPDLTLPLDVLLAPVIAAQQARVQGPGVTATSSVSSAEDSVVDLLVDLAASGVLDAGIDAAMSRIHGYGEPADGRHGAGPGAPTDIDMDAVVAELARVDADGAVAVAVQRSAIELLAHARRTPANERLLKALRRGAVVAAVPAPDQRAVSGKLLVDGSVLVASGRVRVLGARPGGAVLLAVALGDREVWAWTTYGAEGVAPIAPVAGSGTELRLDRLVLRADMIIDTAATERDPWAALGVLVVGLSGDLGRGDRAA